MTQAASAPGGPNLFAWIFGSRGRANDGDDVQQAPVYKTEFHRFRAELPDDVAAFVEKYPIIATVCVVTAPFFGIPAMISINPFSIAVGAFQIAFAMALAYNIWNQGPMDFVMNAYNSSAEIGGHWKRDRSHSN